MLEDELSRSDFLLFKKEIEKLKRQIVYIDAALEGIKIELAYQRKQKQI